MELTDVLNALKCNEWSREELRTLRRAVDHVTAKRGLSAKVGDRVHLLGTTNCGTVQEVNPNNNIATVDCDGAQVQVSVFHLELINTED